MLSPVFTLAYGEAATVRPFPMSSPATTRGVSGGS
jgi:hypothetical protein